MRPETGNSGRWKWGLALTLVLSLLVLLVAGLQTYRKAPPLPERVVDPQGKVLATRESILAGQQAFLGYGLMQYGSILGHGAYKGPDFTAEALHLTARFMQDHYAQERYGRPFAELDGEQRAAIAEQVRQELTGNRYDPATGTLTLTAGQAAALERLVGYYEEAFEQGAADGTLPPGLVPATAPDGSRPREALAHYFFWTGWLSAARRPGEVYSYTNNWPYDPEAGNTVTAGSVVWSAVSVAVFILGLAVVLYLQHRYRLEMEPVERIPQVELPRTITPTQRATGLYLLVVVALFLIQSLVGGYMAHQYSAPDFWGLDLNPILPFSVARSWHVQLAIFWIATAWVATGLYLAPQISGEEPRGQHRLAYLLLGALAVVVVGSLAGQWLGVMGKLSPQQNWLLGQQGWEYLELGRIWQLLLTGGLFVWLALVYRGLRKGLAREGDRGGLTHLLLYSSIGIVMFYMAGLMIRPDSHVTIADYWRWWVIHLWVEGFFEVFTVVVIANLLTGMGLVRRESVLRAVYFQLILLLASGVVGTGHHYYFTGGPELWLALGSVFSAMEVVPLTLLILEAHGQYRLLEQAGRAFPYKGTFRFLIAVALWNLFGAGILGFLINLPAVNYFEHGTWLTPTHGHAALAGVYGFLAVALLLYVLRNLVRPEAWSERLENLSFWGLNLGLMGMILITLLPVGFLQLQQAIEGGYWTARLPEFYTRPEVRLLLWLRIVPDSIFIALGILPLLLLVVRGLRHLRPVALPGDEPSGAAAARAAGSRG
nr:MAG: nitric-oxide reductase large subunit [Bacillota bacterium]